MKREGVHPAFPFPRKLVLFKSSLGYVGLFRIALQRLFWLTHCYLIYGRLDKISISKKERLSLSFKKLSDEDIGELIDRMKQLAFDDKKKVLMSILFYQAGFRNCYLGRTRNGEIACLQWLIYPWENSVIREKFRRTYFALKQNQVIIDNVFTFPKFRGLGVLHAITRQLVTMARDEGYKTAMSYVRTDNIASLNEFLGMGFKIRKILREYKLMGFALRR